MVHAASRDQGFCCRSSELAVVQGVYEAGVQATEGAQCYGHLAQYLDPSQLPWQDRLTRAPEALTAWQPAATAWRALHDYCRAITTEVCVAHLARARTSVPPSRRLPACLRHWHRSAMQPEGGMCSAL